MAELLAAAAEALGFGCRNAEDIEKVAVTAEIAVSENPHFLYSANQLPTWLDTAD